MTDDLTTWLRAIYDERERVARALGGEGWNAHEPAHGMRRVTVNYSTEVVVACTVSARGEHIALNDPAYVLADLDAKRRILERHQPEEHFLHGVICKWCSVSQAGAYQSWPCPDIRDNAAPYAHRPGYREEWKP